MSDESSRQIDDGGLAFPMHVHIQADNLDKLGEIYGADNEGMSLCDWLAGQALAGFCANIGIDSAYTDTIAERAYAQADAMLAARGGGK